MPIRLSLIGLDTRYLVKIHRQTAATRGTYINISSEVACLSVVIDGELKFALHIKRLNGRCFYHLRQLRSIQRSLDTDATNTLVSALITSHVDYCNSLFNVIGTVHRRLIQSRFQRLRASHCEEAEVQPDHDNNSR